MKKKHKILIGVTIMVFAIITVIGILNFSNFKMKTALADKYSCSLFEIRIMSHMPKETIHNHDFEGGPRVINHNEKWVCKYKGREFNVEYTDNQYADDYQLEDIFKWCTEYLQENVDPEIVGVEVFSDIIYHSSENAELYDYSLPWKTNKVFSKYDCLELLKIQKNFESVNGLCIFYQVDDIKKYGNKNKIRPNEFKGNKCYYDFCNTKKDLLTKNEFTKNAQLILTEKAKFSSYTGNISGVSFLRVYSLDANEGVPYVKK